MSINEIIKIENIANEMANFRECYKDIEISGDRFDNKVDAIKLLEFMIDNPHMQKIANEIAKLNK